MRKVLIVEDDQFMAFALREGMETEGYTVEIAVDGPTGLQTSKEKDFDIIVLDVMLPGLSGFDVCRQLRAADHPVPIIMLTARSLEVEKVQGLKIGADDYLTKPFSLMELIARIEAVLRRTTKGNESIDDYQFDDVTLNFKRFEATKGGTGLDLSPREFRIMKFLIEHRGEVVSRDQLLNSVWSYNSFPSTRTVDTHIAKLRQKIEHTPNTPKYLITIHGIGYKFIG